MKSISPTSLPAIKMKNDGGSASTLFHAQTNKIGWVHTKANKVGASFDFVLRDAIGREIMRRPNCKTETAEFGQLMNIDVRMGEDMEVSLENIQGAEEIDLYLN